MDLDPNEQMEREVEVKTAKLVFSPEFIPYYTDIKKEFGISHVATLIYGFIRYFLKGSDEFYFTNDQLGEILDISPDRAGKCFGELQVKKLIGVKYRIKGGGGKVRFVHYVYGRIGENACYAKRLATMHYSQIRTISRCWYCDCLILSNRKNKAMCIVTKRSANNRIFDKLITC